MFSIFMNKHSFNAIYSIQKFLEGVILKNHLLLTATTQIILITFLYAAAGYASAAKDMFEKGAALLNAGKISGCS